MRRPVGRRVLFIDPPSVIREQMISFLVTAQYEAAIIKDPRTVMQVIHRVPGSICYFNIDSHVGRSELEQIVSRTIASREKTGVDVGVLSYNDEPEIARHYLMDLGASAGYITLHIGFQKSARIVVRALEAAEARGERKFVRVRVPPGKGTINLSADSGSTVGEILDISVAGLACRIDLTYMRGTVLQNIQLRLWGAVTHLSGSVAGTRESPDGPVTVILFDENLDSAVRSKLFAFQRRVMQWEIDRLIG